MARKLNKKFVIILGTVIAVGGIGLVAGKPLAVKLFRPSIAKLEAQGDEAMRQGDYEEAVNVFSRAAPRDRANISLQLKLLDAYDYTVQGDIDKYRKLRQMAAQIVTNDPRSVPALERVLKFQLLDVRNAPTGPDAANQAAGAIRSVANIADRILQIDPKHVEARKALISSVLEPYRRNFEVNQADVEKQRDAALALYDEVGGKDAELTQMITLFRLIAAQRAAQQGDATEAKAQLEKVKAFVDNAVATRPEDASAWMYQANTYKALSVLTPGISQADKEQAIKTWIGSVAKADELAKPADSDNELFLEIRSTALRHVEMSKPKEAEPRYRQLVTELPNQRQPRIMLADFLAKQPGGREAAVKVLEEPWKPTRTLRSLETISEQFNQLIETVRLCTFKLGTIDQITDSAERERRIAEVEKLFAELKSASQSSNSDLLKASAFRVEGGIAMERGKISEALTLLDSSQKLLNADSPMLFEQEMRNDVLLEYAQAQLRLGQTGRAKPALTELVSRRPDHFAARATLAQLLINERNFRDATKHVDFLQKMLPGNPIVERLGIAILAQQQDALREKYKSLPESTRDQRMIRIMAAGALGDTDETIRIARLMVQSDPADDEAVSVLVQSLLRTNRREEALAALAAARQTKPDSTKLKSLADAIAAETPEQKQELVRENIDKITDPYQKQLALAEFYRVQGKADESLAALEEARKANPKDGRAPDAIFNLKLAQQKFDEAEALLPTLAELNVDLVGGEVRKLQAQLARAGAESAQSKREQIVKDALVRAAQISEQYREIGAATLFYAQLLQQVGDSQGALEQYGATLDKAPTNLDALRGSIECLLALERSADARKRLDEARQIAPDDQRLRSLELNYDLNFGDPLRAIDALKDTLSKNLESTQSWAQVGGALEMAAGAKQKAGDLAAAQKYLGDAADHYAKAFEKFPNELRFAAQRAELLRRIGRSTEAETTIATLADRADLKDRADVIELMAEQYLRSGKPDDAERILREFITRAAADKNIQVPTSTLLRLSVLYTQLNRFQDALTVLDLRKDDPAIKRQRIELLLAAGEEKAARDAIDEALANNPTPEIYLVAAFVELRSGRFDQAEGFITKVLEQRPNEPAALFGRAQVALNRNQLDAARDDLLRVRDLAPGNVEAATVLADVYYRKRQRDDAMLTLENAWKVNPTAKALLVKLADAYATAMPPKWASMERAINTAKQSQQNASDPDILMLEANMWIARKDMKKAQVIAKQALDGAPTNVELRSRYFDALLRAGAYRDLLKESEPILAEDRGAWWLNRLRAIAYRRLDQKADAQKEFDAAFNLVSAANNEAGVALVVKTVAETIDTKTAIAMTQPIAGSSIGYRLLLAQLNQQDNNAQAALDLLERVIVDRDRMRPEQLRQTLQMLGGAYLQVNPPQPKKARAVYEELLAQTPEDILTLNNLAYVLTLPESGGTPADALKYSTRSYELANTYSLEEATLYVLDTHGWVLVKNGQISDGLDLLRKAAETAKFPEVHLHLAEAYLMANDAEQASMALSTAERIITGLERDKKPIDPLVRPRYEQLLSQVNSKKKTDPSMGAAN